MTCNVGQYLPADDSPVKEIEAVIHQRMRAKQGGLRGRGRGRFMPPKNVEFVIDTQQGDTLHLTGYYVPSVGECFLALHEGRTVLRKFEIHDNHLNPHHRGAPIARTHMHFPSISFPLAIGHKSSYAYSVEDDGCDNVVDCLNEFCGILDIDLGPWQPYLD